MKRIARLSVSLITILFSINIQADQTKTGADQDLITILFIGSSYLSYNNLPYVFENLSINAGKNVLVYRRIINGTYLDYHAYNNDTEAKIRERDWDYIVLQGAGSNLAYPTAFPGHPVESSLARLEQKIHSNSPNTKMVYFMPWAFEDGMTWVQGWTDTYFDMQQIIYEKTLHMSETINFIIAPVGWAFRSVMEVNSQLHYLYLSDYNHPSVRGTYLAASVFYSTIFNESCIGNSFTDGLPNEEVENFQNIATSVVLDNCDLWKIVATYIENVEEVPGNLNLYQNYPNPFNGCTKIGFELKYDNFISLTVYDSLSRQVAVLLNEELSAGKHFFNFNADKLSSGVYYYKLNSGEYSLTKPMLLLK